MHKVTVFLVKFNTRIAHHRIAKIIRKILSAFLTLFILFFLLNVFFPLHIHIEYSTIVTAKDGTVMKAFLTSDDKWRMMTELDEITTDMQKAIIFKEDKYFYDHPGINPVAIVRALCNNIITGKRTSGASTITMQVARLLDPKNRTYGNKTLEIFRALQLDMLYSKKEILQMYLNLVPYGGNIEGVKAASVLYLQKTPSVLSIAELTALSIIPNRPTSLRPGINNDVILTERNKWLEKFKDAHIFSADDIETALQEPFTAFRTEGPNIAPHFCTRMKDAYPQLPIIKTNIDVEIQLKTEKLMNDYTKQLWSWDIHNAAAILIDNKTHQVVAYAGSSDFYDTYDAGQVDGVRAVRSPGSALKPLLYALAFDKGIITPHAIISDVPVNYNGYSPENYDEKYRGNVSVEFALSNSLNIPAVKLLNKIGVSAFEDALCNAQFKTIEANRNKLGLSLALGGCGVTLEELTTLYCAFAHGGKYQALKWLQTDVDTNSSQLISPASAFMITEILTQLTRPDMPNTFINTKNLPLVAWKTGTSYGRKDAWSIGYNDTYTVGIWTGNFSGKGVPELSGATVATPLLFKIFNAVDVDANKDWNTMPASVDFRYVCSLSGKLPADSCNNVVMDYFIPGVSSNELCDHLLTVKVSPDEKISYCTTCAPATGFKEKKYMNYSPEIISWMQQENIPFESIPPHNPDCERIFVEGSPVITSPINNLDYFTDPADHDKIMLQCNTGNDVKNVVWYINDKIYKKTLAGDALFFEPTEGKIKISCSDDKGRNTNITITVHYL